MFAFEWIKKDYRYRFITLESYKFYPYTVYPKPHTIFVMQVIAFQRNKTLRVLTTQKICIKTIKKP